MRNARRFHFALLCIVAVVLGWSGWRPYDRFTWWLEVAPGLVGILVLLATYRRFQFTSLVYTLIALHICVLCVGGHYTYARVPAFDWLRPIFERAAVAHVGSVAGFDRQFASTDGALPVSDDLTVCVALSNATPSCTTQALFGSLIFLKARTFAGSIMISSSCLPLV
jgi:hypothetical protein